jgi:uncharacterized protein (TIGR00661 family)
MGEHLESRGHEVRMVSYDRGLRNLRDRFDFFETVGLHIASRDNRVSVPLTIVENLRKSGPIVRKFRELRRKLFIEFQPDGVITDFEPMTAYLAWMRGVPLITIDNQHRIRYMEYPCPPGLAAERRTTELVIRLMVPRPDVSLATTFYFDKPKNDRTFLFPPILRDDVRAIAASRGDQVLVYLSFGFDSFLERLRALTDERFIVYGYDRDDIEGNIAFRKFSREGFLRDMAASKAVMATAGFTTLTEGLYYRKPYLALPMKGQFEQQLNAHLLETLGYGINSPDGSAESVRRFLDALPEFEKRLETYRTADNSAVTAKLDELLADGCAELKRLARRQGPRTQ